MAGLQKIVKQALSLRTGSILRDKGLSWSICRGVKLSLATAADKEREETSTGLNISDSCVKQFMHITEGEDEGSMLRVMVEGGGCSGFQYKFQLDKQLNADDKVFEREGAKVVIDELSLSFLSGSTVDYHQELIRSSFRIIDNPNAELGCSCGVSFSLK